MRGQIVHRKRDKAVVDRGAPHLESSAAQTALLSSDTWALGAHSEIVL